MYKLCKTEQSAARQRQLELGLQEAMESHHYEQITVCDLCEWMQIPRKSFYRYFSGKEGALYALIDHTLMEYDSGSWLTADRGASRQEMENLFRFWKEQKPLLDALARSGLSSLLTERAVNRALEENSLHFDEEHHPVMTEHEHAIIFIVCGLMAMMIMWHHGGYIQTPAQMAALATGLLTKPLIEER